MDRSASDHPLPLLTCNTAASAVDNVTTYTTPAKAEDNSPQRALAQPQATSAAAALSNYTQFLGRTTSLGQWECELQDMAGAAVMISTEEQCSRGTDQLVRCSSMDCSLRIEEENVEPRPLQLKRRLSCTALELGAADDAVQGDAVNQQSNLAARKQSRAPRCVHRKANGEEEEKENEAEAREEEEEEENEEEEEDEEGCMTPTAREQRIPSELLVCPPAPKKKKMKPSECLKQRRPNFYLHRHFISDDVAGAAASTNYYHQIHVAERQRESAFLVTPPDLQNLPECISALFDK